MRSEGYGTWSVCVCLCVCLSVRTYSRTTRNKAAKKRHQWVQFHTGLIFKQAIFVKPLRSKVKRSAKANMLMSTASPRPVFAALHTVMASQVTQRSSRESKAAFKRYPRIQVSSRSEKRGVHLSLYACVYIVVACVYRCVTHRMRTTCKFSLHPLAYQHVA